MIWFALAFLVFIGCIVAAGREARAALSVLGVEDKAKLVDIALSTGKLGSLLTLTMFVAWFATVYLARSWFVPATIGLLAAILLVFAGKSVQSYRRYRQAGMPAAFLAGVARSRTLRLAGAAVFFAASGLYLAGVLGH